MARRTSGVIDVTEILMHWHTGWRKNELAADRKTPRKYIAPAEAAGITGQVKCEEEWAELVRAWFPQLADTRLRQVTWPAIAVHHDYVTGQLQAGVRMPTIHQRLRDERGLAVRVQAFRRYVAANVPEETLRAQVQVWNPRPAEAGEQAPVRRGNAAAVRHSCHGSPSRSSRTPEPGHGILRRTCSAAWSMRWTSHEKLR
jgi:hypothetical protein